MPGLMGQHIKKHLFTNIMSDQQLSVKFELDPETLEQPFRDDFPSYIDGMCRGQPGGFFSSPEYVNHAEEIFNFPLKSDDVWIVTFPKCGTTWVQEMLWLLVHDCDFDGAKKNLEIRSPFLELPFLLPKAECMALKNSGRLGSGEDSQLGTIFNVDHLASPRVIKSHLPLYLLPPRMLDTCKVVYVARNPKDVIVSFFFHHKLIKLHNYANDLETFADYFLKDQVMYAPFFPHILEAWNLRHHKNLHFMFYEDLKQDLRAEIQKLAEFLGKSLTDGQLGRLREHLTFDNFSQNNAVNNSSDNKNGAFNEDGKFCRKGKTGDWKNHFSAELNERIDRWIEFNLEGSDLRFVTELEKQD